MIKAKIRGPIHHADLSSNTLARKFLMQFSAPLRYLFGLTVGLFLGALHPEFVTRYWAVLLMACVVALGWVLLSLMTRLVIKDALQPFLDDGESLSEYQLMHSKSWIAAVKVHDELDEAIRMAH